MAKKSNALLFILAAAAAYFIFIRKPAGAPLPGSTQSGDLAQASAIINASNDPDFRARALAAASQMSSDELKTFLQYLQTNSAALTADLAARMQALNDKYNIYS